MSMNQNCIEEVAKASYFHFLELSSMLCIIKKL